MFNLVRRDGARENSGHYEALTPTQAGNPTAVGQVVLFGGKPYGIVERIHKNESGIATGVTVLRITDEMEFEVKVEDTGVFVFGTKYKLNGDKNSITTATDENGATFIAAVSDTVALVRFEA